MMHSIPIPEQNHQTSPIGIKLLSVFFMLMLGGGLQTISNVFRPGLWACLAAVWVLIFLQGRSLPIMKLLRPAMPFAIWIVCYFTWGIIVSPVPVFAMAIKMAFYFSMIAAGILILTSSPSNLTTFATYVQFALVLNLVVTLLLMAHPEYVRYITDPEMGLASERILNPERFAGLWGNANQAGFASLFILVLSVWARPTVRWIGRLTAIAIIYLSASRQSTWLFVVILLLFVVIVLARKAQGKVFLFAVCACAISTFLVLDSLPVNALKNDPRIARVLDIHEHETRAKGANSRLDWLKIWKPYLIRGPWYGHGLAAMAGSDTPMTVPRRDVPFMGIHNLYLGLWADIGPLGLLTFLLVVGWQVSKTLRVPLVPTVRWATVSLVVIVLVDSFVKHTLLYDMDGMAAYSLLFFLPASPALLAFRSQP